jgi:hypothetical protein
MKELVRVAAMGEDSSQKPALMVEGRFDEGADFGLECWWRGLDQTVRIGC